MLPVHVHMQRHQTGARQQVTHAMIGVQVVKTSSWRVPEFSQHQRVNVVSSGRLQVSRASLLRLAACS